jgi:hypothetical protein
LIDLPSKSVTICKILANKHKVGVNDFIIPTALIQKTFIPGRRVAENVLLARELVNNYHQERSFARCTISIDMMKAYLMGLYTLHFLFEIICWLSHIVKIEGSFLFSYL